MKSLKVEYQKLITEQRWDIDYHLPPIEISKYSNSILHSIESCADIVTEKRSPTLEPDKMFTYIDISSIDVTTGTITNPQELIGEEAPSRARKVVRAGDIIISTCRPTRGAIAIVPLEMDNQICSTGFSVIRVHNNINNCYLHFILRSEVVKEQFRKFSTGSSYPAILDDDVKKTIIPLPNKSIQDEIARNVIEQTEIRNNKIIQANEIWQDKLVECLVKIKNIGAEH